MKTNLTDELITQLKQRHEELHQVNLGEATLVVVPPSRASWQRFSERAGDDARRFQALEQLARDCVVFPEAEELNGLLERKPALSAALFPVVSQLAGAVEEVESKKL